jgi:hypothetical protein
MDTIIMDPWTPSAARYPEEEWTWRGIVDPATLRCGSGVDELLFNYSFDCGTVGWHFDPNFPAVITDNGDGSVHLNATDRYGSVVPDKQIFPVDTYVLTIEVANVSGNGKMSIRNQANQWFNLETFTTDGTYTVEYTGNIKDIHCGADNNIGFECDFLSYSLKKVVVEILTTDSGETLTTNTGEELTT